MAGVRLIGVVCYCMGPLEYKVPVTFMSAAVNVVSGKAETSTPASGGN